MMEWIADRLFGRKLTSEQLIKDKGLPSHSNDGRGMRSSDREENSVGGIVGEDAT